MNQQRSRGKRGATTLLEILIAVAMLLMIFLFVTLDLLQSSQAENVSATRTETVNAANYLLGVIRTDPGFWSGAGGNDWLAPGVNLGPSDPCGNAWPAYTDTWTSQNWHPAPACTPNGSNPGLFPDLVAVPSFQYMWNVQLQNGNPDQAQLTVWVKVDEGGRLNVYEVHGTRSNTFPQLTNVPVVPTPIGVSPTPCPTNCTSPSPSPSATAKSKPSPTPTPSHTPTPTPTPSGTFE